MANRWMAKDLRGIHLLAHYNVHFVQSRKGRSKTRIIAGESIENILTGSFCKNNLAASRLEVIFTVKMNVIYTNTKHSIKMSRSGEAA